MRGSGVPSFSRGAPAGFANANFANGFEGEISPEDLFNMFFGGGGFGGGPGTPIVPCRVLLRYSR